MPDLVSLVETQRDALERADRILADWQLTAARTAHGWCRSSVDRARQALANGLDADIVHGGNVLQPAIPTEREK